MGVGWARWRDSRPKGYCVVIVKTARCPFGGESGSRCESGTGPPL